jgi:hypothetical protein
MITFTFELAENKLTIKYTGETSVMFPALRDAFKSDFEGTCKLVFDNMAKDTITFPEFQKQIRAELFKQELTKAAKEEKR